MLSEVMDLLAVHSQGIYIDCTLGGGGYSLALLEHSAPDGRVLAIEADAETLKRTSVLFEEYGSRFIGIEGNFRLASTYATEQGFCGAHGAVWDLGLSTDLIVESGRGFSFNADEPLDMRFSTIQTATAADIIRTTREDELADIIWSYGEERYARRIARALCRARERQMIERTSSLVALIRAAVPASYRRGRIHCATRTFQALRIAVNDELTALEESLLTMKRCIRSGGTIAVVSFHSLEDRIVKNLFKQWQRTHEAVLLTKKPVRPSLQEIKTNKASRSAKLRAIRIL